MKTNYIEFKNLLIKEGFENIYEKVYSEDETYKVSVGKNKSFAEYKYVSKSHVFVFWNNELNVLIEGTTYPKYTLKKGQVLLDDVVINSGHMRYTVKLKEGGNSDRRSLSSYGSNQRSKTITGDHDIRYGAIFALHKLKEDYDFVKWEGHQFLWLLHYSEHRRGIDYDYEEINRGIFSTFPDYVKKGMNDNWSGAPLTLKNAQIKIEESYFHYDDKEKMTIDDREKWFNENIKNKSLDEIKEFSSSAHFEQRFLESHNLYKEIQNG